MTGVLAPVGRYRAALAELPMSTRLVHHASGAIVVVPGVPGWVDTVLATATAGAVAVVVAEPAFVPSAELRRLERASTIPVVVERPLLRPDVILDARTARTGEPAPRIVAADGAARGSKLAIVARDAVGWLRVLTGEELAFVAADGALALFETLAGIAATMSVVVTERPGDGWIRAQALGETIIEVEVEGHGSRVTSATAAGRLTAPVRFESSERLAMRRALSSSATGDWPDDLGELAADTELVERTLLAAP